jgi:hypothetical protein
MIQVTKKEEKQINVRSIYTFINRQVQENVYNKFRKHPDVNLAINALKEVSNEISMAAFQHLGNYAKEV